MLPLKEALITKFSQYSGIIFSELAYRLTPIGINEFKNTYLVFFESEKEVERSQALDFLAYKSP